MSYLVEREKISWLQLFYHFTRLRGATVARLTPDQKVACSNHVGVNGRVLGSTRPLQNTPNAICDALATSLKQIADEYQVVSSSPTRQKPVGFDRKNLDE